MGLNALDHPILLSYPRRTAPSAWTEHIPLAMLLVDLLRPSVFVELGTHFGTSYCAFCQAVKELAIDCTCYAIDTWRGDGQAGHYGQEVLDDLKDHHDPLYSTFSHLVQSLFDDACPQFADGSIDLLHIDGYHTYEAVRHDFDLWLPKMSDRGVVVFHDIAERTGDFGVWKLWSELEARYPNTFSVAHNHGLGVVAVGANLPEQAQALFALKGPERAAVRTLLGELGRRISEREEVRALRGEKAALEASREREQLLAERLTALQETASAVERQTRAALDFELSRSQEERDALQQQVRAARAAYAADLWQLKWLESSRGVRLVKLARASRAVLKHKGLLALGKHGVRWLSGKRGYYLKDIPHYTHQPPAAVVSDAVRGTLPVGRKAVLFVSGVPDSAMRYRCAHQAESLGFMGLSTDVGEYGQVNLDEAVDRYACFVLHRVPDGPDVEAFMTRARHLGKPVFFDTDDWVFDPQVPRYVPAYYDLDEETQKLYVEGLHRYRRTLMACDGVLVTTESLRQLALRYHDHIVVAPNVASQAMVEGADAALEWAARAKRFSSRDTISIGYFSGTATHNRDFLEAADAILWALQTYPDVVFKVIGQLKLDDRFEKYGERVVRFGLRRWQDLPHIYTTVDISIAPLEPNNPYTDAKSCIKYLEASLCATPTIASSRTDFRRVIEDGVNGFLADTPDAWKQALAQLIESPELRREMGRRASEHVRADETTLARAANYEQTLISLTSQPQSASKRPLAVNWILHAPIAERGGGYRTIFHLANYLGKEGHTVRVYVEPTAHMQGMSTDQIRAYVRKHFGSLTGELIVGHDHILPADASIATFWTTARTVEQHAYSLHKLYFIQDFEPEFYDAADDQFVGAEESYTLPLQHICIGEHLGRRIEEFSGRKSEVIDFAVDHTLMRMKTRPSDRPGPLKVLFFARPGLKRRGFELGIEALRRVKAQRPDVEIILYGSTDEELGPSIPFKATNLGVINQRKLVETLNHVHIQLSFSLTNISWVPFEGMACGAAVVEADVPSVRCMVPVDAGCLLARPEPEHVATTVLRLLNDEALRHQIAAAGVEFMAQRTWDNTAKQFEDVLLRHCWLRESGNQPVLASVSATTSRIPAAIASVPRVAVGAQPSSGTA